MLATRRAWLMAGAAAPAEVTARPPADRWRANRLVAGQGLSIVGDGHAKSLALHLSPLCRSTKVILHTCRPSSTEDELVSDALLELSYSQIVLVSWPDEPPKLADAYALARARGRSLALVGWPDRAYKQRSVPTFPASQFSVQLGPDGRTPTAAGYSAWAGAIWHWLR